MKNLKVLLALAEKELARWQHRLRKATPQEKRFLQVSQIEWRIRQISDLRARIKSSKLLGG